MKFCQYRFTSGQLRGVKCNQPLIATCDRSKPSKPTEFAGRLWTESNPQTLMMYPEADDADQSKFCFYHQSIAEPDKLGGES